MNCPNCQSSILPGQAQCGVCGHEILLYVRVYRLSNLYYNKGLEKAKVRDLSGAISLLKRCLKMNNAHTDARNLLGLLLYEQGEVVAALSQWVISRHFKQEDNEAGRFMECIQAEPAKLDLENQAVKKYNIALDAAKQGNEDLAVIQLKKVISLNSKFLRAAHLLSLLYIKMGDYERADKLLKKIAKIDTGNTMTKRYQQEIRRYLTESPSHEDSSLSLGTGIMPITKYREDKPNIFAWVNWFLGMAVGIALTFLLIVPTVKKNIRSEYNQADLDYAAERNILMADITSKEKEIDSLGTQLTEKDETVKRMIEEQFDPLAFEPFFDAVLRYLQAPADIGALAEEEICRLADTLYTFSIMEQAGGSMLSLITEMQAEIYPMAAEITLMQGIDLFESGEFAASLAAFTDSYKYDPDRDTLLYYLGLANQSLNQYEQASSYYQRIIEEYADSQHREDAGEHLEEIEALTNE